MGEHTLHSEPIAMAQYITENNLLLSISTNGLLFNDNYYRNLKHVGLNTVHLSLNFFNQDRNNISRYCGVHTRIL